MRRLLTALLLLIAAALNSAFALPARFVPEPHSAISVCENEQERIERGAEAVAALAPLTVFAPAEPNYVRTVAFNLFQRPPPAFVR